jgi:polyisoprenoid-binding protein YceI
MKTIILLIFAAATVQLATAQLFTAPQGKIHFHSSAPLEDIDAISSEANCELNTATKKVVAKVDIPSFVFPKAMMQQHFNDSYLESDKYRTATLDAEIVETVPFKKDGVYKVTLKGTLDIHGVKQNRLIYGKITVKNGQPQSAYAEFEVRLKDHNIKIPNIVIKNIAEVVKVDVNFIFNKQP